MTVEIVPGKVIGLNISKNESFKGGEVAQSLYAELKGFKLPDNNSDAYFFVTMFCDVTLQTFVFSADVTWEFTISPLSLITPQDVYKCVEHTTGHLQEIAASIYSHQKSGVLVGTLSFDFLLPQINDLLQALRDN